MTKKRPSLTSPQQLKSTDIPKLRNHLLKKQNGICPICERQIEGPCLDHSHTKRTKGTGLIRGVLCRSCNIFIAKSENNCVRYGIGTKELPRILRNCADYLERKHLPYIHPSERPKDPILAKRSYKKLHKVYSDRAKFPGYPKSGKLTKRLSELYKQYNLEPEYYKK